MRTSTITLLGLAAVALSVPTTPNKPRQADICSGADSTPLCCDVDVLGVADLDCSTPPTLPTDISDFVNICAAIGKIDMCCILPILGQGIICNSP
ncbi:hypothetical protein B7463_g4895, partial [Scytalidium lignicola]